MRYNGTILKSSFRPVCLELGVHKRCRETLKIMINFDLDPKFDSLYHKQPGEQKIVKKGKFAEYCENLREALPAAFRGFSGRMLRTRCYSKKLYIVFAQPRAENVKNVRQTMNCEVFDKMHY